MNASYSQHLKHIRKSPRSTDQIHIFLCTWWMSAMIWDCKHIFVIWYLVSWKGSCYDASRTKVQYVYNSGPTHAGSRAPISWWHKHVYHAAKEWPIPSKWPLSFSYRGILCVEYFWLFNFLFCVYVHVCYMHERKLTL